MTQVSDAQKLQKSKPQTGSSKNCLSKPTYSLSQKFVHSIPIAFEKMLIKRLSKARGNIQKTPRTLGIPVNISWLRQGGIARKFVEGRDSLGDVVFDKAISAREEQVEGLALVGIPESDLSAEELGTAAVDEGDLNGEAGVYISPVGVVVFDVMDAFDASDDLVGALVDGADEVTDLKRTWITVEVEEQGHLLLPVKAAIVAEDVCGRGVYRLNLVVFGPDTPRAGD